MTVICKIFQAVSQGITVEINKTLKKLFLAVKDNFLMKENLFIVVIYLKS